MIKTSDGYMVGSHPIQTKKDKIYNIIKGKISPYKNVIDRKISEGANLDVRKKIRADWVKEVEKENAEKNQKAYLNQKNPGSRSGGDVD